MTRCISANNGRQSPLARRGSRPPPGWDSTAKAMGLRKRGDVLGRQPCLVAAARPIVEFLRGLRGIRCEVVCVDELSNVIVAEVVILWRKPKTPVPIKNGM